MSPSRKDSRNAHQDHLAASPLAGLHLRRLSTHTEVVELGAVLDVGKGALRNLVADLNRCPARRGGGGGGGGGQRIGPAIKKWNTLLMMFCSLLLTL